MRLLKVSSTHNPTREYDRNQSSTSQTTVEKVEKSVEKLSNGLTFDQLLKRAEGIQDDCEDYIAVDNTMGTRDGKHYLDFKDERTGKLNSFPMSDFSFSQLCTKMGVPIRYMDKCSVEGKDILVDTNLNTWLSSKDPTFFVRTYKEGIRGILSKKYSTFDAPQILNTFRDSVNVRNYDIKGHYLNPERLHVRFVGKEMLPVSDEDLFAGIFLDSSDVGRSTLKINLGIWKQVCTNGLVIPVSNGVMFQQRHIGITPEEFCEQVVSSLKDADSFFDSVISHIVKAREIEYFNSPILTREEIADTVSKRSGLSVDGSNKVVDLMDKKYGRTKWGYINSITEVAQDYTLERRLELEERAGKLLVA